jgi:hypothetical protein
MNTMLVVGSAPCLYDDVAAALELRPLAEIFLINGACTAIENAEHMLAGHEEKSTFFAEARRKAFQASSSISWMHDEAPRAGDAAHMPRHL